MKIFALCCKSSFDSLRLLLKSSTELNCTEEKIALNSANLNYIEQKEQYGLKLDEAFLNYMSITILIQVITIS